MSGYAHPEMLVETGWVEDHLTDPKVRLVEVDVDTDAYDLGHLPNAIGWNWTRELCDLETRDILSKERLESLMQRSGIEKDTTVVLYGDNNNWFAAWALWQLQMHRHPDVKLMNDVMNYDGSWTEWGNLVRAPIARGQQP
jgi:thiosulfate/3-mercaptopyruvate sulfurtransferase